MKSRGHNKQNLMRVLYRIAMEELVENAKELLEIKAIKNNNNNNEKIYELVVRVKDEGEYIAHAVIRLIPPASNEGYIWKLVDFWWEEVK